VPPGQPPNDGDLILVTEGYATGLSIREATVNSVPVYVAFDAGNLKPVAERLRARYPLSPLIFCADDDWKTKRPDGTPWNPGVEYAQAAAREVGYAWVIRPLFVESERQDGGPTSTTCTPLAASTAARAAQPAAPHERTAGTSIKGESRPISQEDREIAAQLAAIREWREDPAAGWRRGRWGRRQPPPGGSDTPSGPGGGGASPQALARRAAARQGLSA
jgi:phage/plasmid primase-like uncharacterized protein